MKLSNLFNILLTVLVALGLIGAGLWIHQWLEEGRILRKVVDRLTAESRVAEVLVTKSEFDETTSKIKTAIKFLEYDVGGQPLESKYFTFYGNIIQFQTLVIRFQDKLIKVGDKLKGKSAYLFMKAFVLEGANTQEFPMTQAHTIPAGYKIAGEQSEFEAELWQNFWDYALDPAARERAGIKNAQLEAPGTMFLPGTIYTIMIEHDGGLRIDSRPVPQILKGENL